MTHLTKKKLLNKIPAVICVLSVLSSCTPLPIASLHQDSVVPEDHAMDSWIGEYAFTEAIPPEETIGGPIVMRYVINIYKWEDSLYAYIAIDGRMNYHRLRAEVLYNHDEISLVFDEHMKDKDNSLSVLGNYFCEPGTILLSFRKQEDDIITIWERIQPILKENKVSGDYFDFDPSVEFSLEIHDQISPIIPAG